MWLPIHHFAVDGAWYLMDLLGYGYARVSKTMRRDFEDMLHRYTPGRKISWPSLCA